MLAAATSTCVLQGVLAAESQKPGFRSNVTHVEVDIVVTDKSGLPVRGLGQGDFEIFEDDRAVDVATFSAIDVAGASRSALPEAARSGSAFASNDRTDAGRLVLIVLDDVQVDFTAGRIALVKSVARRAVERLGPADLAGVMTTSGRRGGQAEFTTDKSRLNAAIERFVPQAEHELPSLATAPPSVPGADPQSERVTERKTLSAMAGLTAAARALGTIHHRRKGVLLISQGFPAPLEAIIRDPRVGAAWESVREFILTAQRNNVAVYTVDPCGLEANAGCNSMSRQNLRTVAEETSGFAVVNTNAPDAAIDRMLAENGTYYLVGYNSPAPPNDGKHHGITVRTRVPNVEIRARRGYDAPAKAVDASAMPPLEAMTHAAIATSGLTMRVVAIPAPLSAKPFASVIVGIELPRAVATRAGRVDFAIVAIDQQGAARATVRFTTDFAAVERGASSWIRTGSRIDVPPGEYQLRVAAAGGDQSQGSVFTDVSVPAFDAELGVGGLSLGAASSSAVTAADRLRSVLTLIPLTTNEITPRTAIAAQLPIKVSAKAASDPLTIVASLVRSDAGRLTIDRSASPARSYASAGGKIYQVVIPRTLDAGTYRVVVEITLNQTTIVRELAFVMLPQ
jgi:VWFA-related protein